MAAATESLRLYTRTTYRYGNQELAPAYGEGL